MAEIVDSFAKALSVAKNLGGTSDELRGESSFCKIAAAGKEEAREHPQYHHIHEIRNVS